MLVEAGRFASLSYLAEPKFVYYQAEFTKLLASIGWWNYAIEKT